MRLTSAGYGICKGLKELEMATLEIHATGRIVGVNSSGDERGGVIQCT